MTDRELQEINKMWELGMSASRIARLMPYKEYFTRREITKLKKSGFLKPRNVAEIRSKAIIAEFEHNKNLLAIADKFGLSLNTVRFILCKNGVKHPKVMNFTEKEPSEKVQHIIAGLRLKMSQSKIAKKHQVSRQYVFQIKERYLNE